MNLEDGLLSQKDAAKFLAMAVSTLRASRAVPFVLCESTRIGGRPRRKYRLRDLQTYIEARTVNPASLRKVG
jgi:hypothetical protein